MVKKNLEKYIPSINLLLIILVSIIICITFILSLILSGKIPYNVFFGFQGITGYTPDLTKNSIKILTKDFINTENFVEDVKTNLRKKNMSDKKLVKYLSKIRGKNGRSITAIVLRGKNKGVLVTNPEIVQQGGQIASNGGRGDFCSPSSPYCDIKNTIGNTKFGENLWNYKNKDGSYPIKMMCKIALSGGGWMVTSYKNALKNITSKYTYVSPYQERNILLSSKFYTDNSISNKDT